MKQKLLQTSIRALLMAMIYLLLASCEGKISMYEWHVYTKIAFSYAIIQAFIIDINYGRKV